MEATTKDLVGSALGLALITGLNTLASGSFEGDEAFYNSLKRPKWAPPDWAFAPIWAVNNALNVYGDLRIARGAHSRGRRSVFAATQGVFWASFFAFGAVYFRKKSPMWGFICTATGAAASIASVAVAVTMDRKAAAALAPTAIWTTFAGVVSGKIAFDNIDKDPTFGE